MAATPKIAKKRMLPQSEGRYSTEAMLIGHVSKVQRSGLSRSVWLVGIVSIIVKVCQRTWTKTLKKEKDGEEELKKAE
jgi:hypothetical protein